MSLARDLKGKHWINRLTKTGKQEYILNRTAVDGKRLGRREGVREDFVKRRLPTEIRCPNGTNTRDLKRQLGTSSPCPPQNTSMGGWEIKISTVRKRQWAIVLCSSAELLQHGSCAKLKVLAASRALYKPIPQSSLGKWVAKTWTVLEKAPVFFFSFLFFCSRFPLYGDSSLCEPLYKPDGRDGKNLF